MYTLEEVRKKCGFRKKDIATLIGVSEKVYDMYEKYEIEVPIPVGKMISKITGVSAGNIKW